MSRKLPPVVKTQIPERVASMQRKYFLETSTEIITNDVYLAAYLMCEGCILEQIEKNDRKRVSFILSGDDIRILREDFRVSTVRVSMPLFRDTLICLRRRMDEIQQRSIAHASTRLDTSEPTQTVQTHAHA